MTGTTGTTRESKNFFHTYARMEQMQPQIRCTISFLVVLKEKHEKNSYRTCKNICVGV